MSGSMSLDTPPVPVGVARAAGDGTGAAAETGAFSPHAPGQGSLPPVPSPPHEGHALADQWPRQDFIELAPLPSAAPCARLHAQQVLWEWRLAGLNESAELVVSELVTNAVAASHSLEQISPIRMWLLADTVRALILVWDGNPQLPVRLAVDAAAESGRGLLLVEAISSRWGSYATPQTGGKAVWALIEKT
jgi:Histidine kinase-like ATPase domain